MNILVTGSAGYIGSVLLKYLLDIRKHIRVTVFDKLIYDKTSLLHYIDNPKFVFINGDVRDDNHLLKEVAKADVIISLAALVGAGLCEKNPVDAELVNFRANKVIAENKSKNQLLAYFNTNSGYGATDGKSVITEECELNPISLYGKTKVAAEEVIRNTENHIIFRLATVFGRSSRMRTDLLVNNLVLKAIKERVLVLYESSYMRNYIHVRDVCRALVHAIKNNKCLNNVYNVGNDTLNMSKLQLCQMISEYLPVEIIKAEFTSDLDKRNYIVSSKKFYDTGFECKFDLDYGIMELIKVYNMIDTTIYANY